MPEQKLIQTVRDGKKWRKNLAGVPKRKREETGIRLHPAQDDFLKIKELSDLTGESMNQISSKLVHIALHNKTPVTQKLEWQRASFGELFDAIAELKSGQETLTTKISELNRQQKKANSFAAKVISEIYCLIYVAVNLLRAVLINSLAQAERVPAATPKIAEVVNQKTLRSIQQGLEDFEKMTAHHRQESEAMNKNDFYVAVRLPKENNFSESVK
jgi:LysM repeat protein